MCWRGGGSSGGHCQTLHLLLLLLFLHHSGLNDNVWGVRFDDEQGVATQGRVNHRQVGHGGDGHGCWSGLLTQQAPQPHLAVRCRHRAANIGGKTSRGKQEMQGRGCMRVSVPSPLELNFSSLSRARTPPPLPLAHTALHPTHVDIPPPPVSPLARNIHTGMDSVPVSISRMHLKTHTSTHGSRG